MQLSMKPSIATLIQALRHAAVGVAVLAVLMMSFRIHLHRAGTVAADGCGTTTAVWTMLGDAIADPTVPDQDPGEPCDCPSPNVSAPEHTIISLFTLVVPLDRVTGPTVVPTSRSYPPDPPPARLS